MSVLQLSASQLLKKFRSKELSPVEVLNALIAAFPDIDIRTNAFLDNDFDGAMIAAKTAEAQWAKGEPIGQLCGVPVSVKDSIEVAGMKTTYGSVVYRDNRQPDGLVAQRLRKSGAVIFAKTNLPEFALRSETANRLRDSGRNPWNLDRTCGGSSGGSAIAVATGLGPISIGTDSGGSIRGPSAQNGIFGFKPSFQRIPTVQTWRAAVGRSHNGPMTRTLADAVLMMNVIGGYDSRDPESLMPSAINSSIDPVSVKNLKIGVVNSEVIFAEGNDVMEALRLSHDLLKNNGVSVKFVDEPPAYSPLRSSQDTWPYGGDHLAASQAMLGEDFLEKHGSELTDYALKVYSEAVNLSAVDYRRAQIHDAKYRQKMADWLVEKNIDILIMKCVPPAAIIDPLGRISDRDSNNLAMYNISRLPVASIPVGFFKESKMPMGLQVVGRYGQDDQVLGTSEFFENEKMWNSDWPVLV